MKLTLEEADNASPAIIPFNEKTVYGDKLDPMFLAVFHLLDKKKNVETANKDSTKTPTFIFTPIQDPTVTAIVTDGSMEITSNYNSPFESSNPENKLPNLMAMIQSGQLAANIGSAIGLPLLGTAISDGLTTAQKVLDSLDGSSNLTKVNSTQIFVSTAPIKITLTLFFQAWANAKTEVEDQLSLLQSWALPVQLSEQSVLVGALENLALSSFFPSKVPPFVSLTYGKKTYSPLLIESVSDPIRVERDSDGNRLAVEVAIVLTSRTAIDQGDWTGTNDTGFRRNEK
jgi:hypothetical protein